MLEPLATTLIIGASQRAPGVLLRDGQRRVQGRGVPGSLQESARQLLLRAGRQLVAFTREIAQLRRRPGIVTMRQACSDVLRGRAGLQGIRELRRGILEGTRLHVLLLELLAQTGRRQGRRILRQGARGGFELRQRRIGR